MVAGAAEAGAVVAEGNQVVAGWLSGRGDGGWSVRQGFGRRVGCVVRTPDEAKVEGCRLEGGDRG